MKTLGEFWVAGYGIDTNVEHGYTKDIAAYWETYTGENMESRMYARLSPPKHGEVGLCVPGRGGNLTYLFGVMPETLDALAPDMRAVRVPAAQYAVFTTKPVDLPPGDMAGPDRTRWPKRCARCGGIFLSSGCPRANGNTTRPGWILNFTTSAATAAAAL